MIRDFLELGSWGSTTSNRLIRSERHSPSAGSQRRYLDARLSASSEVEVLKSEEFAPKHHKPSPRIPQWKGTPSCCTHLRKHLHMGTPTTHMQRRQPDGCTRLIRVQSCQQLPTRKRPHQQQQGTPSVPPQRMHGARCRNVG